MLVINRTPWVGPPLPLHPVAGALTLFLGGLVIAAALTLILRRR